MSEVSPRVYDAPGEIEITEAVYRGSDSFLGSGREDFRIAVIDTPESDFLAVGYSAIQPGKMEDAPHRGVNGGRYLAAPAASELELSRDAGGNFSGLDVDFPAGYRVTPYGVDSSDSLQTIESFMESVIEAIDWASQDPLDAKADDWMR